MSSTRELRKQLDELTVAMRPPVEADYANISLGSMRTVMLMYGWHETGPYGEIGTLWENPDYGRDSQVQFPNEKLGDHVRTMWWIVHVLANRVGVIPNKILGEIVRAEISRGEGEAAE